MRILLLADIHANLPALKAIQEPFDVCLVLGDLVDYGLEPGPCIAWVRQHATHAIRGNHDHSMGQQVKVAGHTGYQYLTAITRPIAEEKLSKEDRRFLVTLPVSRMVTIDSIRFLLVHGTPRDPLDEYAAADVDFWKRRLQNVDADVICVGHTHQPYVLEVGEKLVINPGSVGQPRDGDPRASYAIIENRSVELKRIEYPVEETVRSILQSSLPESAKGMLAEVFRTGALPKRESDRLKGIETPHPAKEKTDRHVGKGMELTQVFDETSRDEANLRQFERTRAIDETARDEPVLSPGAKPGPAPSLADYRLLQKIGEGGMGEVYQAQQISTNRMVAIKVLFAQLVGDATFVKRFQREGKNLARLDHPHILQCYEVNEVNGTHYIAMEYADGGSIENWLKKLGKFSVGDAVHVLLACARGLSYAHEQGLVHRDMKPDNLLLTRQGVVKVADLGLAKAHDDMSVTKTGTGAGTPIYMAPEQARDAKRVDGRSDIYALGCMLYRFLTGEIPFPANNVVDMLQAKERGTFRPAKRLNAQIPAELDLMIDKMLAKRPEHRFQNCGELIAALEALGVESCILSFFQSEAVLMG